MGEHSCHDHGCEVGANTSPALKRVLVVVLILNAVMFAVEMTAGVTAGSAALQADALDFLGDAVTYALSFAVLGMALRWRARAALLKGVSLLVLGLYVVGITIAHAVSGTVPEAPVMGVVGFAALAVNLVSAGLLFRFREGDANIRSVWLCSRNDAIGNVAVMAAAAGVWGTNTGWPDIVVGGSMALLWLSASWQIVRQARKELQVAQQESHAV